MINEASGTGVFQIIDLKTREELKYLPVMPEDRTDVEDVVAVLHHMAKYKLVEGLSNSTPGANSNSTLSMKNSSNGKSGKDDGGHPFSVTVTTDEPQKTYYPGEQAEIRLSDEIKICVENNGSTDLYVYIYALSPLWEIEHVHHATLAVAMARQSQLEECESSLQYRIEPRMPDVMEDDPAVTHFDDILKVFVTTQETAFDMLEQQSVWSIRDWASKNRAPSRWSGPEKWAAFNFPVRTWV